MSEKKKRRSVLHRVALFLLNAALFFFVGLALLLHPRSPLPPEWRPEAELRVSEPVTLLSGLRLRWTANNPAACRAALIAHQADITLLGPLNATENCGVSNRVEVSALGGAGLRPVETNCATALRLAMWEAHSLQPAARDILGAEVREITHLGSYSCRRMRTSSGNSERWSSHATADAVDITGVVLSDGRRITLVDGWDDVGAIGAFLREIHLDACRWFRTTLGPDFNALHADHFHLQATGWGSCR